MGSYKKQQDCLPITLHRKLGSLNYCQIETYLVIGPSRVGLAACLVMKLSGNLRSAGRESLLLISSWFYKVIDSDKDCTGYNKTLFIEMLYLVRQLPKANWLLTELHMGDLSCPNLRLYFEFSST